MLETVKLTTGYGGAAVVYAVSLNVAAGEIVALLGANGAGKTTMLSTIFGTLAPISGEIRFDGESIGGRSPHRNAKSGIGYVPEGRALAPSLTVTENLRLVSNWRLDPFELFPEFGPLRNRRVGLLSGGEQQMLTVARALLRLPKLLLVDELSFGLAPIIVDRLLERVKQMAVEKGVAVLLVEQHVGHALRFADRAYVMSRGRIVLDEPATSLLAHPELLASSYLGETPVAPDA